MTRPTILDALGMWSHWHGETSPLGSTGDYALDLQLADAFRALLYRPTLNARLDWLQREVSRPRRRPRDSEYHAELITWWLHLYEAEKVPVMEARSNHRRLACASS